MLLGTAVGALLVGAALHILGEQRQQRRYHTAGWVLSIIGAFVLGDALWDSRPGVSIAVVVAALVLVNGLPSLVAGLRRRRTG